MKEERRYLVALGFWRVTIFFMTSYVERHSYFRERVFKFIDFEIEA